VLSARAGAGEGLRARDPDADPGGPGAAAGAVRRGGAAVMSAMMLAMFATMASFYVAGR